MGMTVSGSDNGRARRSTPLTHRYWRATTLTYAQIRDLIMPNYTSRAVRTTVDAIPLPAVLAEGKFNGWLQDTWAAGDEIDPVMGAFSSALQFNCDVRDVAILNDNDMSVADIAWKTSDDVTIARLRIRLHYYTIRSIAALNYDAVGRFELTAFTRAIGLGLGLLPSPDSRAHVEWEFTVQLPDRDSRNAINAFHARFPRPLGSVCTNILSMFGLFHLSKDRTFKPGDADMTRTANSYLESLGTCVTREERDAMALHMESVVRTGPHPFGLAQTYWLARVMGRFSLLTSSLAVRLDVSPPTVQRLMIAKSASGEWGNLQAGRAVDGLFAEGLGVMNEAIDAVRASAPSYSSLHRLYGVDEKLKLSGVVEAHVEAMMPAVYGFIKVFHEDGAGNRDGLGYALSLTNVGRDKKFLSSLWQRAWAKCLNDMDNSAGLVEFVESMRSSARPAPVGGGASTSAAHRQ